MPAFTLVSLANIETAISAVTTIDGAYQSVGLLADAMAKVEEPQDFTAEVQKVEQKQGFSYEGPEDAGKQVIKAVRTAANASGKRQDKLLELVSLVVTRLGVSQGTRVLSVLLLSCGIKPTLIMVVLKLCVMLSRTKVGRQIVAGAQPRLKEAVGAVADKSQLAKPIQQLAANMGAKGGQLISTITGTPLDATRRAILAGGNAFEKLLPGKEKRSS
ncbi:MAG: hypothetical protein ISR77_19905 [Pirellulaceae bacterium]|nr:hypothetical protein [Pirellulaceae bacterium]